jgi:hypothetical protein
MKTVVPPKHEEKPKLIPQTSLLNTQFVSMLWLGISSVT